MRKVLIIMMLGMLALSGCKTKYVSVPEWHERYVARTDTLLKQDSIYVRDSVFSVLRGDTVYIGRVSYRDRYKYVYRTKVDTVIKRDSIPYPVIRELTKNEQRLISIGKCSILMVATLCVFGIWYRNKNS